jgi:DNA N-6-adenine-methyltransferase (Dam)
MSAAPPVMKTTEPFTKPGKNERFCWCLKCKKSFVRRTYQGGRPKRFCCDAHRQAYARKIARDMRPNEFYTPSHIIEIARACMGGIDLDPASSAAANETVRAATSYDIKQDGLKQQWFGQIFMNPPYGKFSPPFVRKAVQECKSGMVRQVIILLNGQHLTARWLHDALAVGHLICLPHSKLNNYRLAPVGSCF